MIAIVDDSVARFDDAQITGLLQCYVDEGFTVADVAAEMFRPAAVRTRGQLFGCLDDNQRLIGMIIVVQPSSAASVLAEPEEIELHLLAVDPRFRGRSIGEALVRHTIAVARRRQRSGIVLFTQPEMKAAHRLYERCGFERTEERDFDRRGKPFWSYRLAL